MSVPVGTAAVQYLTHLLFFALRSLLSSLSPFTNARAVSVESLSTLVVSLQSLACVAIQGNAACSDSISFLLVLTSFRLPTFNSFTFAGSLVNISCVLCIVILPLTTYSMRDGGEAILAAMIYLSTPICSNSRTKYMNLDVYSGRIILSLRPNVPNEP